MTCCLISSDFQSSPEAEETTPDLKLDICMAF